MKKIAHVGFAFALGLSATCAVAADPHAGHHAAAPAPSAKAAAMSEGEVKKIDKQARKLTIKHGPLANLDMPPMTMVFSVKDASALEQVKVGDKIRFVAVKNGPSLQVERIERLM